MKIKEKIKSQGKWLSSIDNISLNSLIKGTVFTKEE